MSSLDDRRDRRAFLRLTLGLSTGALLAACGGGGGETGSTTAVPVAAAPPTAAGSGTSHPLNLALNLAYLGGNFFGVAATGTALSAAMTAGVGTAGGASGGRRAALGDPTVAALAAELAADKAAHVAALRGRIGAAAAAQPAIDLSTRAGGAFSLAAQGASIVGAGASFDPYADDRSFLLGAFLIERTTAAAHRTFLVQHPGDDGDAAVVAPLLADAIYHGGSIRSLLDAAAQSDPSIDVALRNAAALFASLDGTNVGDQSLAGASGVSADVVGADGIPIPFTRASAQILSSFYLSTSGPGGFFPAGANGVA